MSLITGAAITRLNQAPRRWPLGRETWKEVGSVAGPLAAAPSLEQELEVSLPAGGYGSSVSSCLERRRASWRRVWAGSAVL